MRIPNAFPYVRGSLCPLRRGVNPSVAFGASSLSTREPWFCILYSISPCGASLFLKMGAKNPPEDSSEGHLFRSIRHQASLFIFSVIWLFLRAAAFL